MEKKNNKINVRVEPEIKEILKEIAAFKGITISDLILEELVSMSNENSSLCIFVGYGMERSEHGNSIKLLCWHPDEEKVKEFSKKLCLEKKITFLGVQPVYSPTTVGGMLKKIL